MTGRTSEEDLVSGWWEVGPKSPQCRGGGRLRGDLLKPWAVSPEVGHGPGSTTGPRILQGRRVTKAACRNSAVWEVSSVPWHQGTGCVYPETKCSLRGVSEPTWKCLKVTLPEGPFVKESRQRGLHSEDQGLKGELHAIPCGQSMKTGEVP